MLVIGYSAADQAREEPDPKTHTDAELPSVQSTGVDDRMGSVHGGCDSTGLTVGAWKTRWTSFPRMEILCSQADGKRREVLPLGPW